MQLGEPGHEKVNLRRRQADQGAEERTGDGIHAVT